MRISTLYKPLLNRFRAVVLAMILLTAFACSPYLYENEISVFKEGINSSLGSFEELKGEERERRIAIRNERLKTDNHIIKLEGCEDLQSLYEDGFFNETRNVLTESDYQKCQINPVGDPKVDLLFPNLTDIGEGLQNYANALSAVSNAEDVTNLQNAFTEFNTNVKVLLEAVNQKLSEKGEEKFAAISGLVYQTGFIYLNQRRFDALKKAVNETDPVIKKASELLAKGAFDMYNPKLLDQFDELTNLRIEAAKKTGDEYVPAWLALKSARDTYVELFRKSPVGVFQLLVDTHAALRQSVNDPGNQGQIDHILTNAKAFRDSAMAVLDLLEGNDQNGDGKGSGS